MSVLVLELNLACSTLCSLEDWEQVCTNKAPWGTWESLFEAMGQNHFFFHSQQNLIYRCIQFLDKHYLFQLG